MKSYSSTVFFQELQEKENAKEIVEYNQVPVFFLQTLPAAAADEILLVRRKFSVRNG